MDPSLNSFCRFFRSRIGWICLAALLLVTPALVAAQTQTLVKVKPAAEIKGERILLSQVASIAGPDPLLVARLGKLDIGKAPLPGRKKVIASRQIYTRMEKNSGGLPPEVGLDLPRQLEVRRKALTIERERIERIATDWIMERVPWAPENVTVTRVRTNSDVVLPHGEMSYAIKTPGKLDFLGTIALSIEFSVDGQPAKRAWVTLNLEVITPVVVLRRPLGRHQPVTPADVTVALKDIAKLPAGVFTEVDQVVGMRARRTLYGNTVLREDLVEMPPLVKRGDLVTIVAEAGTLRITARGEVKATGRRGERISVVNLDSRKRLSARVIDARTVKVDF